MIAGLGVDIIICSRGIAGNGAAFTYEKEKDYRNKTRALYMPV